MFSGTGARHRVRGQFPASAPRRRRTQCMRSSPYAYAWYVCAWGAGPLRGWRPFQVVCCKTRSFIHVEDHLGVAARAGAPLRRAPGGAAAPMGGCLWCGARVGSEWRARVHSGWNSGPAGRGRRPRIPFEFQGNSGLRRDSKGTRKVLEVLRNRHFLQLLQALCSTQSDSIFELQGPHCRPRRRRGLHLGSLRSGELLNLGHPVPCGLCAPRQVQA